MLTLLSSLFFVLGFPSHPSRSSSAQWLQIDPRRHTATLMVIAHFNDMNNGYNLNGGYNGNMTINIPESTRVTVTFINNAPHQFHSLALIGPHGLSATRPILAGASISAPLQGIIGPHSYAVFTFMTPNRPRHYRLACLRPGHLGYGMYLDLNVTPSNQ
ncbi:sulfocyanin-like copper-binding protein [Sulfobacillus thermosulfidooxidans]|uniref:sulfocyanin-like copper-binding protein n=1 Tax=Sulfobacillus thermosulfidooxidans TaxID=28034 RepID=UPI0006B41207|nr:sulfocyanin-like copper-binding protein [Sulfobacillus thermosulfidooxidans]